MADDTNIDDILKSIDALLKESEADEAGGDSEKRRSHEAINDDEQDAEPGAPEFGDVGESGDEEPLPEGHDEHLPDEGHISALQQAGDAAEMDDHPTNRLVAVDALAGGQVPEEQATDDEHISALQQAGDAAEMDDHPTNRLSVVETPDPGAASGSQPAAKRIVLSEDMLVEQTPDLLAFVEQSVIEEASAAEAEPAAEEEPADEKGFESAVREASEALDEAAPIDMELLIEQISRDITARLQDKLPRLVAKAVRKHLVAQLAGEKK